MKAPKLVANNKGQFIIIAVLMVAIMVVSVASIMYGAVTYFRHEQWEEYLSIIDNVDMGASRLVELSLVNYTLEGYGSVLKANLDKWQTDLLKTYSQYRVVLNYTLPNGGAPIYYGQGLNISWNRKISFSAANAQFKLNITSVGLTGYKFTRSTLLNLTILDVLWYPGSGKNPGRVGVRFNITMEGLTNVNDVQKINFLQFSVNTVNQLANSTMYRYYDSQRNNCYVHELRYTAGSAPSTPVTVLVSLVDTRNIRVVGQASISQIVTVG